MASNNLDINVRTENAERDLKRFKKILNDVGSKEINTAQVSKFVSVAKRYFKDLEVINPKIGMTDQHFRTFVKYFKSKKISIDTFLDLSPGQIKLLFDKIGKELKRKKFEIEPELKKGALQDELKKVQKQLDDSDVVELKTALKAMIDAKKLKADAKNYKKKVQQELDQGFPLKARVVPADKQPKLTDTITKSRALRKQISLGKDQVGAETISNNLHQQRAAATVMRGLLPPTSQTVLDKQRLTGLASSLDTFSKNIKNLPSTLIDTLSKGAAKARKEADIQKSVDSADRRGLTPKVQKAILEEIKATKQIQQDHKDPYRAKQIGSSNIRRSGEMQSFSRFMHHFKNMPAMFTETFTKGIEKFSAKFDPRNMSTVRGMNQISPAVQRMIDRQVNRANRPQEEMKLLTEPYSKSLKNILQRERDVKGHGSKLLNYEDTSKGEDRFYDQLSKPKHAMASDQERRDLFAKDFKSALRDNKNIDIAREFKKLNKISLDNKRTWSKLAQTSGRSYPAPGVIPLSGPVQRQRSELDKLTEGQWADWDQANQAAMNEFKTPKFTRLAGTSRSTGRIKIDKKAVQQDWDDNLPYMRHLKSTGQHFLNTDIDKFKEALGTADGYYKFIKAHEGEHQRKVFGMGQRYGSVGSKQGKMNENQADDAAFKAMGLRKADFAEDINLFHKAEKELQAWMKHEDALNLKRLKGRQKFLLNHMKNIQKSSDLSGSEKLKLTNIARDQYNKNFDLMHLSPSKPLQPGAVGSEPPNTQALRDQLEGIRRADAEATSEQTDATTKQTKKIKERTKALGGLTRLEHAEMKLLESSLSPRRKQSSRRYLELQAKRDSATETLLRAQEAETGSIKQATKAKNKQTKQATQEYDRKKDIYGKEHDIPRFYETRNRKGETVRLPKTQSSGGSYVPRGGSSRGGFGQLPQNKLLASFAQLGMMASGLAAMAFLTQIIAQKIQELSAMITDWNDSLQNVIESTDMVNVDTKNLGRVVDRYANKLIIPRKDTAEAIGAAYKYDINPSEENIEQMYALQKSNLIEDYKEAAIVMELTGTTMGNNMMDAAMERWDARSETQTNESQPIHGNLSMETEKFKNAGIGLVLEVWKQHSDAFLTNMRKISDYLYNNQGNVIDYFNSFVNGIMAVLKVLKILSPALAAIATMWTGKHLFLGMKALLQNISKMTVGMVTFGIASKTAEASAGTMTSVYAANTANATKGISALGIAVRGLGAAFMSVLPALVLTGVAVAGWHIYKHIKKMRDAKKLIESMKTSDQGSINELDPTQARQRKTTVEKFLKDRIRAKLKIEDAIDNRSSSPGESYLPMGLGVTPGKGGSYKDYLIMQDQRQLKVIEGDIREAEKELTQIGNKPEEKLREDQKQIASLKDQIAAIEQVNTVLGIMPKAYLDVQNAIRRVEFPYMAASMGHYTATIIQNHKAAKDLRKVNLEVALSYNAQKQAIEESVGGFTTAESLIYDLEQEMKQANIRTREGATLYTEYAAKIETIKTANAISEITKLKKKIDDLNESTKQMGMNDYDKMIDNLPKDKPTDDARTRQVKGQVQAAAKSNLREKYHQQYLAQTDPNLQADREIASIQKAYSGPITYDEYLESEHLQKTIILQKDLNAEQAKFTAMSNIAPNAAKLAIQKSEVELAKLLLGIHKGDIILNEKGVKIAQDKITIAKDLVVAQHNYNNLLGQKSSQGESLYLNPQELEKRIRDAQLIAQEQAQKNEVGFNESDLELVRAVVKQTEILNNEQNRLTEMTRVHNQLKKNSVNQNSEELRLSQKSLDVHKVLLEFWDKKNNMSSKELTNRLKLLQLSQTEIDLQIELNKIYGKRDAFSGYNFFNDADLKRTIEIEKELNRGRLEKAGLLDANARDTDEYKQKAALADRQIEETGTVANLKAQLGYYKEQGSAITGILSKEEQRTRELLIQTNYQNNEIKHGEIIADMIKRSEEYQLNTEMRPRLTTGEDMLTALETVEKKLVSSYETMGQIIEQSLNKAFDGTVNALNSIIWKTTDAKTAFKDLARSVLQDLTKMIIKQEMFKIVMGSSYEAGNKDSLGGIAGFIKKQFSNKEPEQEKWKGVPYALPQQAEASSEVVQKSMFTKMFSGIKTGLTETFEDVGGLFKKEGVLGGLFNSMTTGFGNLFTSISKMFQSNSASGGSSGGGGSSLIGTALGWLGNMVFGSAQGNVVSGISAYRNQIVSRPTLVPSASRITPYATGGALFGEAGPEAIMPLARMASGNLGVNVQSSQTQAQAPNIKIEVINNGEPVEAETTPPKWDGEQFVLGVVLDAAARNKGGFRNSMKGMLT